MYTEEKFKQAGKTFNLKCWGWDAGKPRLYINDKHNTFFDVVYDGKICCKLNCEMGKDTTIGQHYLIKERLRQDYAELISSVENFLNAL